MESNLINKRNLKKKLPICLLMVLFLSIALGVSCTDRLDARTADFEDSAAAMDSLHGIPNWNKAGNCSGNAAYSCAAYVKRSTGMTAGSAAADYSGAWAIMADGAYCLKAQPASGSADGMDLVIDGFHGAPDEIYLLIRDGDYYRIRPVGAPDLAVHARYGKNAREGQWAELCTWKSGDAASLWAVEKVSGGVRFINKANPSLVLNVSQGRKTQAGNGINLWTLGHSNGQTFQLKAVHVYMAPGDESA